jgi:hypothetical protein
MVFDFPIASGPELLKNAASLVYRQHAGSAGLFLFSVGAGGKCIASLQILDPEAGFARLFSLASSYSRRADPGLPGSSGTT